MGGRHGAALVRDVGRLYRSGAAAGRTDGELLARFVDHGDDAAVEALLARHAPMVLSVCRRFLRDPNDAADAFQATLLVLVRRAPTVRADETLGPWLYGVAYRVASRARAATSRRRDRESAGLTESVPDRARPDRLDDLGRLLHDELARLPVRLREPVVLCHLEGLTHAQAADRLGCPVGTVRSRLARGRARLRERLERRGVDASTVDAQVWPLAGPVLVPPALMETALRAVSARGAGVAAAVAALTEGVLMPVLTTRIRAAAAALMLTGLTAGAAVFATPAPRTRTAADPAEPVAAAPAPPPARASTAPDTEAALNHRVTVALVGTALGETMNILGKAAGLNLVLDPQALAARKVTTATPVSLTGEFRLKTALKILLQPLGLTFRVVDDVVLVTLPPDAVILTRTYYVGDLLDAAAPGRVDADLASVVRLVTTAIAPGHWRVNDAQGRDVPHEPKAGPADGQAVGSITPFYLSLSVIVRHTPEVHEQVAALFRGIRGLPRFAQPDRGEAGRNEEPLHGAGTGKPATEAHDRQPATAQGPRLKVALTGPSERYADALAGYELTVGNPGTAPARNVRLQATLPDAVRLHALPAGATFDREARRLTWTRPTVEPGETAKYAFRVRVGGVGPYEVAAEAKGDGGLVDWVGLSTVVTGMADVGMTVTEGSRVVDVNEVTTFRIKVENRGTREATRVAVTAVLSDNLEPLETSGTDQPAKVDRLVRPRQIEFPRLEQLGPGKSVELGVRVRVKPGASTGTCLAFLFHDGLPDGQSLKAMDVFKVSGDAVRSVRSVAPPNR